MWIGRGGPITGLHVRRLHSASLFPVGSHEELDLRDPRGIRGRPAGAVYDFGGCCTPEIGDGVHQNMLRRYRVCIEVAGSHIEPLF